MLKKIQSFLQEGMSTFYLVDDIQEVSFVTLYIFYPKILFGFYENEFGEKNFQIGIETETTCKWHNSIEDTDDNTMWGFQFTLFGFGIGFRRQKGY
jgi:hypothetical protein